MPNITNIPVGYCQCGCGQKTTLIKKTYKPRGYVKGEPHKFVFRHNPKGENNSNWKGGAVNCCGYKLIRDLNHPRARKNGYVAEHILLAEKALGKPLPPNAVVHHASENKQDNSALVVCESESFHQLLHLRMRAYKASGNPNYRKCSLCMKWDNISNMALRIINNLDQYKHRKCESEYKKAKYKTLSDEKKAIIHQRKKDWINNNRERHAAYHKEYRLKLKANRPPK